MNSSVADSGVRSGILRGALALLAAFAFVAVLGAAGDAEAQAADQKRGLKASKQFYKVPGMIDVDVRAMRGTLMITGSVPSEDLIAKADELGGKVRGVKEVRNRLRVRPPLAASVTDADLMKKIDAKIEEDEDLARARRKFEVAVKEGNVTLTGRMPDYTVVQGFISDLRRMKGVQTIDFEDLKY